MKLHIDIETLPTDDEEVIESLRANIKAPANYSKPETIAKWHEENGEQALQDAIAKTSFDGLYGRIACICWALNDGEVSGTLESDNEQDAIARFYDAVCRDIEFRSGNYSSGITIVGHNVAGFDLPFLKHRSIIHGIKPQADIRKAMNAKPWDSCIADTMLMWSSDSQKRASMDKLCKAFGIDGKGDFDGSMVAETWPTDPQKVIDYCKADVVRTREIYKRITFGAM